VVVDDDDRDREVDDDRDRVVDDARDRVVDDDRDRVVDDDRDNQEAPLPSLILVITFHSQSYILI